MSTRALGILLASLTLALGAGPTAASASAPTPAGVTLVALHFGHSGFRGGGGGGLFRRSPYGGRGSGLFGGRRASRSRGLLRRIGHALAIGYLLHLLFSGGGGILLLIIIVVLFLALRRRRRARATYGGRGGVWR